MKTVWTIGRFDLPDADALARNLDALLDAGMVRYSFASPREAAVSDAECPDLIVVVQHRPHEFSPDDGAALLASQPLAAFVVALGPWCASSGRSERLWPDSIAVPLWDAMDRIRHHVDAVKGTVTRLPLTASRDEAVLFDADSPPERLDGRAVSIVTWDRAFRDLLSEVLTDLGAAVQPLESLPKAGVVLWDVTASASDALEGMEAMRSRYPDRPIVAILPLPTATEEVRLRAAGVAAIMPKPFTPCALTSTLRSVP